MSIEPAQEDIVQADTTEAHVLAAPKNLAVSAETDLEALQQDQDSESSDDSGQKDTPFPSEAPKHGTVAQEREREKERKQERVGEVRTYTRENLKDLAPKDFEKLGFLTFVEDETKTFKLNAKTDRELYDRIEQFHRIIQSLPKDDPNISKLSRILEAQFPHLEARVKAIEKWQGRTTGKIIKTPVLTGKERIFHSKEELITALGLLDQNEALFSAAFGQMATNNGKNPIETTIPTGIDFNAVLKEAVPSLPEKVISSIAKTLDEEDSRGLKILLGSLSGSDAGAVLGFLLGGGAGLAAAGPAGAIAGSGIGGIAGELAGAAIGAGIGNHWDIIVGKKGESTKITLNSSPTESRIVTSFADKLGSLGWGTERVGRYIAGLEKTRHEIWQTAGVDLDAERGMIDLGDADPSKDTLSRGAGLIELYNNRQTAMEKLTEGKSRAEFSPEDWLRFEMDSIDAAAGQLCGNELDAVIDEMVGEREGKKAESLIAVEQNAKDLETGKTSLEEVTEDKIEAKKQAVEKAEKKLEDFKRIKEELDEVMPQVREAQKAVNETKSRRDNLKTHHETILAGTTTTGLEKLANQIQGLEDKISNPSTGLIHKKAEAEAALYQAEARIKAVERQISALERKKETISTEHEKSGTTEKYTAAEVTTHHNTIAVDIETKQDILDQQENEKNKQRAEATRLDTERQRTEQEIIKKEERIQEIRDKIETADEALLAATENFAPLENDKVKLLQEMANLLTPPTPGATPPTPVEKEAVSGLLVTLQREAGQLEKEKTELEGKFALFESGKGKASSKDKKTAEAMRRAVKPAKEINRIVSAIILEQKGSSRNDLSAEGGFDNWQELYFGPEHLRPEDQAVNRKICSKADMVMTAVDVWHLSDEYFGRDEQGNFRLTAVRENVGEIRKLKDQIDDLKRRGKQTKRPEANIQRLRTENYKNLTEMYDQTSHLFGVNQWKTAEFALELSHRLVQKALTDPFALEASVAIEGVRVEKGVRETGIHHRTEAGVVHIEPPHKVGGVEQNHGTIKYSTPEGYRNDAGQEISFVIETAIKKPESSNAANALEIKITKRKHTGEHVLTHHLVKDTDDLLTHLAGIAHVPDLSKLYTQSVGEMLVNSSDEEREKYFKQLEGFTSLNITLGGIPVLIPIDRGPNNRIEIRPPSGILTLSEWIKKIQQTTQVTNDEIKNIYERLGKQALQSMQRY